MEAAQDNTVAIVAIAVSGGVALLVAIIGAITAHSRQTAALDHDRDMRIREDGIAALDEAMADSYLWVGRLVRVQNHWMEAREPMDSEVGAVLRAANESNQAMYSAAARLDMRFGQGSDISKTYEELLNAARSYGQALKPYTSGASFTDHAQTVSQSKEQANDALERFVKAAKDWLDKA